MYVFSSAFIIAAKSARYLRHVRLPDCSSAFLPSYISVPHSGGYALNLKFGAFIKICWENPHLFNPN